MVRRAGEHVDLSYGLYVYVVWIPLLSSVPLPEKG